MNIRQISKFLGKSDQKVYRLITSKKLRAKLIKTPFFSYRYYITPKHLEDFLGKFYPSDFDSCPLTCLIHLCN